VKTVLLAVPATDVSANQAPLEPDAKRGASINLLARFLIKEFRNWVKVFQKMV
jgi:hypothetical protein